MFSSWKIPTSSSMAHRLFAEKARAFLVSGQTMRCEGQTLHRVKKVKSVVEL